MTAQISDTQRMIQDVMNAADRKGETEMRDQQIISEYWGCRTDQRAAFYWRQDKRVRGLIDADEKAMIDKIKASKQTDKVRQR